MEFKRVPAIDKCFKILEFLSKDNVSKGISEIAASLKLNKSTVFNMVYTLSDLGVLDNSHNRFKIGTKLYMLGKAAEKSSDLIRTIHPYMEQFSRKTNLSTFLGIRSGLKAIIIDKVDSSADLKISSEIGIGIPLIAGAHGKAILSLLSDDEIEEIVSKAKLKKFTPFSCTNKKRYSEMIQEVRKEGIAIDKEEYLEGVRALAVPLKLKRKDAQAAVWAVGLKNQIMNSSISAYSELLKEMVRKFENQP